MVAVEYPGYFTETGKPCESGLLNKVLSAMDWLIKNRGVPPERIILLGSSLGTHAALALSTVFEQVGLVVA